MKNSQPADLHCLISTLSVFDFARFWEVVRQNLAISRAGARGVFRRKADRDSVARQRPRHEARHAAEIPAALRPRSLPDAAGGHDRRPARAGPAGEADRLDAFRGCLRRPLRREPRPARPADAADGGPAPAQAHQGPVRRGRSAPSGSRTRTSRPSAARSSSATTAARPLLDDALARPDRARRGSRSCWPRRSRWRRQAGAVSPREMERVTIDTTVADQGRGPSHRQPPAAARASSG